MSRVTMDLASVTKDMTVLKCYWGYSNISLSFRNAFDTEFMEA